MEHILDNPIWNALISGNKNFSAGNDRVKHFSKDVSPFVGFKETVPGDFNILYDIMPSDRMLTIFTPDQIEIPDQWTVVNHIKVLQMVYNGQILPPLPAENLVALTEQNVPAMIALTTLTNPGPFFQKTIEFGNYEGIFNGTELIAMAGQRLQVDHYTEISAVCTHPDHHGKRHAGQLIKNQIRRITAESCIPFLHVRIDNAIAVKLYKTLGFQTRREMTINTIQKMV